MNTWTNITDDVAACEREIAVIRLNGKDKVTKAEASVQKVAQKREELKRAHAAEVKELVEQSENQLARCRKQADAEIEAAMTAKRRSEVHREALEGRLEHAESTARRLEQEAKELQSMIKKVVLDQDARYEELRSSADALIQAKREETDLAVHETSQLATDMRDDALSTLAAMHSQLKGRLEQSHTHPGTMDVCRSTGAQHANKVPHRNPPYSILDQESLNRSRYRDICSLSRNRGIMEDMGLKTGQHFEEAKTAMIKGWYQDWVVDTHRTNKPSMISATRVGTSHSVPPSPRVSELERDVGKDGRRATRRPSDRVRAKERAYMWCQAAGGR